MTIFKFFDYVRSSGLLAPAALLDFGDRVTFLLSGIVLLVSSLVIGAKEYFTKPISCMLLHKPFTPLTMMDAQMIESYCWVTGVYPLRMTDELPYVNEQWLRKNHIVIRYYLWVPLLLGIQALLSYLPKALFDLLCFSRPASHLAFIAASAREASLLPPGKRAERVGELTSCLKDLLLATREYRRGKLVDWATALHRRLPWCPVSKRFGNYTFVMYLATKLVGLTVLVLQLELMRKFLGFDSLSFGADLLRNITTGLDWEVTMVLPRLGVCHLSYQDLTSVNSATTYCTMSSNIFTEKVYIILWFYFTIATVVSATSVLTWLRRFTLACSRRECLRSLIKGCGYQENVQNEESLNEFESDFIRIDGLFFVWMIRLNCGHIVTGEIVRALYADFVASRNRSAGQRPIGEIGSGCNCCVISTISTVESHL